MITPLSTYRDKALSAWQAEQDTVAQDQADARAALVAEARAELAPVVTDAAGKSVSDAADWAVELVDADAELVVLTAPDASVSVGVYPRAKKGPERWVVVLDSGKWRRGDRVADLADVGRELTEQDGGA